MFPYENRFLEPFEAAVRALNPVVAVKVRSAAVHVALSSVYVQVTMYPRCSPADSAFPVMRMRLPFTSTMTLAYKSLTPCSIYPKQTRSSVALSL